MEWTGFTDEQLGRLKRGSSSEQDSQASRHLHRQQADAYDQQGRTQARRAQLGRGRAPPLAQNRFHGSEPKPLDQSQMLSRPKHVQQRQQTNQRPDPIKTADPSGGLPNLESVRPKRPDEPQDVKTAALAHNETPHEKAEGKFPKKDSSVGEVKVDVTAKDKMTDNGKLTLGKELDEKEGLSRDLTKLEEFQQRQKEIEDENHRKKKILSMAISDRKKKTQAEVVRLAFIQKELSKIEEFLTTDVNILRDKIEEASRHYSEAQRRYQKAEVEFVAAKIHLHKLSDRKEALTEHLCTIIRENELRKAKKLEELTEQLDSDNFAAFEAQLEAMEAAKKTSTRVESENQTSSLPISPTAEITSTRSEEPKISASATESNFNNNPTQGSSAQTNEPVTDNPLPCCPTQGQSSSTENETSLLQNSTSDEIQRSLDTVENDTQGLKVSDKGSSLETTQS